MKNISILCAFVLCASILHAQQPPAPIKIGEEQTVQYATAHPYTAQGQAGVVFEQEFYQKHATYIKLYFEGFDLGPNDYIEISTHNTGESIIYAGKGKIVDQSGHMISDFWSMALMDDRVTVRLHSTGQNPTNYGFAISKVAYGYPQAQINALLGTSEKSICGNDDKERVACYTSSDIADKSRAVCRLLINGTSLCTGWLLGSEGHIVTNNHCISSNSAAQNTDFRFNYQHSQCFGGGLASSTTYSGATLVKTSSTYDYSLLKLSVNPTRAFGYLQISPDEPQPNDRIYIVGHPSGSPKEVSVKVDNGNAVVAHRHLNGILYYADTEPGSSGSPVLDYNSHQVVALHNLGGCPNESQARSDKLISSIGSDMPLNGIANSTSCSRFTISSFPYTESFESGLGAWFNETGDDFDWSRKSGSTPSSGTGPSAANNGSCYVYTEASSYAHPNKKFILESSCFNLTSLSSAQMSFRYHMYGAGMGELKLQYSLDGANWSNLWSKSGNQGNSWHTATVNLNPFLSINDMRFRFVGTTGTSPSSDMAIDYIRITGTTPPIVSCTSHIPHTNTFNSSFEEWEQSTADNFNWTRRSGSTPTGNTGPSSGYQGTGQYIYVEATGQPSNSVAILEIPCKYLSGNITASFYYHMYGSNTGTLQLLTRVNNGPWNTVWIKSGNQGNSWQYASVALNNLGNNSLVKFRLRASIGNGPYSDIAIDQFELLTSGGGISDGSGFGGAESANVVPLSPFFEATPNPFRNALKIRTNLKGSVQYRLTNLQGQPLQEGNLQHSMISVENIPTGVYFLTLFNEETRLVQKVVKQ